MNNAEDNYQIIRQLQEGRDFLLTMLEQNPSLLKTAEPRIRELFEYARGESVSPGGKQRGISLIELIIFIVIISVALTGILLVMNSVTRHSADPLIHKQALAIAESLLEEVELMPFTYCDPDDASAVTATAAVVGGTGCATTVEAMGSEAGELRGSTVTPLDNVNDYNALPLVAGAVVDINGNAAVTGYTASVAVTQTALDTVPNTASLRITVTVTGPDTVPIVLDGYRTRYSPNSVP